MSDDKFRQTAQRLQRLAEMESLAEGGWQELYNLVGATLQRLNQAAGADLLEVRPHEYEGGDWTVAFRSRDTLQFRVSTGGTEQAAAPSSPPRSVPAATAACAKAGHPAWVARLLVRHLPHRDRHGLPRRAARYGVWRATQSHGSSATRSINDSAPRRRPEPSIDNLCVAHLST